MIRVVDLAAAHAELRTELEQAALRVLRGGHYLRGPEAEAFEHEFAAYCGVVGAVGVGTGSDAVRLVLQALGVGPGDEVVVPALTAVPTWLAISAAGARPVPAEPDDETLLVDPAAVEAAIGPRTAAIVAVHLYGLVCDVDALAAVARRHGLAFAADASQAHGARYRGRSVGELADAAAFSLYPTKNLGAAGNGGVVVSGDERLLQRVRVLACNGGRSASDADEIGINSALGEMNAAMLRVKLRRLDEWNDRRRRLAALYRERLGDVPALRLPALVDATDPVWHQFVVRVQDRDELRQDLRAMGVETLVHYEKAPHEMGAYSALQRGPLPITERISREVVSIPVGPHVSDSDCERVCDSLEAAVAAAAR
jgi:dTDP-3-amino-3,4,6-trideoxy-alpha-D-glucose transaminase